MKVIKLTKGFVTLVDDRDYEELNRYSWVASVRGKTVYAQRYHNGRTLMMHRQIMSAPKGSQVDHINRNSLDNQRSNLRLCTEAQNKANRVFRKGKSGYRGVYPVRDRFYVQISVNGKRISLGCFGNAVDAAKAYDDGARKYHGEFAVTNFDNKGGT